MFRMALLMRVIVLVAVLVNTQAYLTGRREETCDMSFGQSYSLGQSWTECSPGRSCCFKSCACLPRNGRLSAVCHEACPGIVLNDGCEIIEPFQNATFRDCCRIQCREDREETCDTSFGQSYREGESWTECSSGRSCCFKSCDCIRQDGRLSAVCHEACPRIFLNPGCDIIEPFQNATFRDCCRVECGEDTQTAYQEQVQLP